MLDDTDRGRQPLRQTAGSPTGPSRVGDHASVRLTGTSQSMTEPIRRIVASRSEGQ